MRISIIVPTYNEEKTIGDLLEFIEKFKAEIIIADGGSSDQTLGIAAKCKDIIILNTCKGRAQQMNQAANIAKGAILLFLHADCIPEHNALDDIAACINQGYSGGCLSQRISSHKKIFRFIEGSGNLRAKFSGIFYGDQAIFVKKDVFLSLGGFDDAEIFEDILFSKKLCRNHKVRLLKTKVYSSPRRWHEQGIIKTTLINWLLTLGFVMGFSPKSLKKIYADIR
ncbi:MAG: TIGR04283 family arsenosugar biosynthesis glycosyltransferase [Candidatus Omnitrophica bacterium]|nr:TIGR04283 family arsenosugar biosynthesis glycosyltransferase [Candidatus Omnitrophota bacterium]